MAISVKNLNFFYGSSQALFDINLDAQEGDTVVLLGPSGAGKSTLIRTLNLLEVPTSGELHIANNHFDLSQANNNPKAIRQLRQDVGMVFQQYNLWPHLTVIENLIEAPKKVLGISEEEAKKDALELLKRLRLEEHADRFPLHLSGGQQQRIAIARAVVNKPKVLLLDESLSALDYKLRKQMQNELKQLQRQLGITFIFVTHDQEEAITMSDRIVLLRKGKIAQDGLPREIYEDPANLFVARFIGEINVFDATVIERKSDDELLANVEGRVCDIHTSISAEKGQKLQVLLRPEDIVIEELDENEHSNAIIGRIVDRTYKGMTLESTVEFDHNGKRVLVSEFFNEDDPHMDHSVGQRVGITWHEGWEVVLNDEDNQ